MTLTLRDYQVQDIDRLREAYRSGARAVLYQAPTGSGKTVLFANIVRGAAELGHRIWIVVHRQELLSQCSRALTELELEHGIIAAGRYGTVGAQILVCSVQTLVRRIRAKPSKIGPVDFIVFDEAHHAAAGTWRTIIDARPQARLLGVTATPMRLDGKGLGVPSGGVFDAMVVGPAPGGLIEQGYLSPFTVYAPPNTLDLSGVKRQMGDFAREELATRVDKPKIIGDAVEHYQRICPGHPAIAFCASVAHAEHVSQQFTAAGWRSESIDGTLADNVRRQRVADLATGRIHVLTSCEIISEGVDIPVVSAAILLRPTQSLGLYLQQVGRCLRPAPGKERAIILDHVGNCARHGFPDDERDWTLDGLKNPKIADPVPPIRTCGSCYAAFRPAPECPVCGAVYELKAREIEEEAGDLEEVTEFQRAEMKRHARQQVGRAQGREELEAIAAERGYKSGWVDHMLRARGQKAAL